MWLKKLFKRSGAGTSPVKRVFFVLSTGRCGTRYVSNLLNTAPNATVLHQPHPGCESINPIAYGLFVEDCERYASMRVDDFTRLRKHAEIYKTVATPVYGDCYNSIYPFGIALFRYFQKLNIDAKFIHLVRDPVACASSILRAEGPFGIGERKDFGIRAGKLYTSTVPAEIAAEIWIGINRNIAYQMHYIERHTPDSTRMVKLENIQGRDSVSAIRDLFYWIGLDLPDESALLDVILSESDDVRHSHQMRLDGIGIPRISDDQLSMIISMTGAVAAEFGY